MAKIHTRTKRKCGLSTRFRHYRFFHSGQRKNRAKSFKTEESAHAWALKHGLKPEQYSLKRVKRNKKVQVVMHNGKDKNIADKKDNT